MTHKPLLAGVALLLAGSAQAQNTSSDVQVVLGQVGTSAWTVESLNPPGANVVTSTGSGNPNPTMSLEIGKRYKFTNPDPFTHPFMAFATGTTPGNYLIEGASAGSLEGNASVDWFDSGNDFYLTLSPALADALGAPGNTAKYACINHPAMEGLINFKATSTQLAWPSGAESFENALVGGSVNSVFAGWVIATGSANYTAVVSQSPAGHPGQAAGSTRWLTVTDNDGAGSNRVYTPGIVLSSGTVGSYTFTLKADVQSLAAGPSNLIISQHFDGTYKNVGGLEITSTGVNVIVMGSDFDSGIGTAGTTTRATLYNFADAGGFGLNNWVTLSYTLDFQAGTVSGSATGSNGSTNVTQSVSGLALQGAATANDFRLCIRNNQAGTTSLVSYDNVNFAGTVFASNVDSWPAYQ